MSVRVCAVPAVRPMWRHSASRKLQKPIHASVPYPPALPATASRQPAGALGAVGRRAGGDVAPSSSPRRCRRSRSPADGWWRCSRRAADHSRCGTLPGLRLALRESEGRKHQRRDQHGDAACDNPHRHEFPSPNFWHERSLPPPWRRATRGPDPAWRPVPRGRSFLAARRKATRRWPSS